MLKGRRNPRPPYEPMHFPMSRAASCAPARQDTGVRSPAVQLRPHRSSANCLPEPVPHPFNCTPVPCLAPSARVDATGTPVPRSLCGALG
eukprot:1350985-Alexandrium_andersonii.AAC.1